MKLEGSESINQRHGSADPDPHQNVMDPQHCWMSTPIFSAASEKEGDNPLMNLRCSERQTE
jgi:hypothetical protein